MQQPLFETMAKTRQAATCDDCYFRREGLCALPITEWCPTFRAASAGTLTPPKQARLVPRPLARFAVGQAA
jgi:hypothetical protein